MNLFQLLRSDHRALSGLLARLERHGERSPWLRRALLRRARHTLEEHQHAENVLHAALREQEPSDERPCRPDAAHQIARKKLADLERCGDGDDHWRAKVQSLGRTMRQQMLEEERVTFARARRMLDPDDARALADALAEARMDGMPMRRGPRAFSRPTALQSPDGDRA